jgi:histidinol-phosphate aminotransferase
MATAVRVEAARLYGTGLENLLIANGSDELLAMIVRACVDAKDKVAMPWPTYTLYETLVLMQGGDVLRYGFPDDYGLPEPMRKTAAKVVFICNPNSPTGTAVTPAEIEAFANAVSALVVVDEAYVDFADADCMALAGKLKNVIVLRTLSKGYSLCGIRCGIGVSTPEIIEGLLKVKDSYNLNSLTIAGAAAALADSAWARSNADRVKATRARLSRQLTKMGFSVLPSQSNFLWAEPLRGDAKMIYEKLKERRILVRYFPMQCLNQGLRITVGTDAEVDALLAALEEILGEG